ncbi:MAG: hypothetical protein DME50_04400 [Verrucomicrobia bacterium]|nr:MAG: hypothetical protein DME50_04400 [Verrucomicrobiota bacterium]
MEGRTPRAFLAYHVRASQSSAVHSNRRQLAIEKIDADKLTAERLRNGLTKTGRISINGVSCILKFPETKHPWRAERRQKQRLSFSETLLRRNSP